MSGGRAASGEESRVRAAGVRVGWGNREGRGGRPASCFGRGVSHLYELRAPRVAVLRLSRCAFSCEFVVAESPKPRERKGFLRRESPNLQKTQKMLCSSKEEMQTQR